MARPVLEEWRGERLRYLSPRETINRFGWQAPSQRDDLLPAEIRYFEELEARVPAQDGPVAPERAPFTDEAEATAAVKQRALEFGADLVGVTRVDERYVYEGCTVPHAYAAVLAVAMDYDEILELPRPETQEEFIRVYNECSRIAVELAAWIRALGYAARAHTLRREELAMLPHAYAAGLGELGKHGSLINRELGCSFRLAAVTTDVPLREDAPRSDGIEDFCRSCQMCSTYCPGDAISDERDVVRGVEKWVVDTERCAPYFGSHYACGICIQVCPFNAKAFAGAFRDRYVKTMRSLDPDRLEERLTATLRPLPEA